METKHKEGDTVFAYENPKLRLTVSRCVDRIYYCRIQEDPTRKELIYTDRELMEKNV